jgi:uncharacterized protein (TIGR03086 family)
MPEILAVWRRVADGFSDRLSAVQPEDWSKSTCCDGWDVAALVDHAIGAQRMVPKALGAAGDIDAMGEDPVQVWKTVRTAADAALSAPGALDQTVKLPFGEMRAQDGFGFPFGDLLIHTWDLARAVGADDRLLPEACTMVLAQLEPIDALIRRPGVFGPKFQPAPGGDIQDQLLAFVGRQI